LAGENGWENIVPFLGAATAKAQPPPDAEMLCVLRALRDLWRRTQLAGRGDFDRACLLIGGNATTTAERYASAFFQGAQIFARRRMTFFNSRSATFSDDEMWLARILQALHNEDHTSARYLMALRIAPDGARRLMFLAQGLASHLWPRAADRQDRQDRLENNEPSLGDDT
jgi:hypothetical protein